MDNYRFRLERANAVLAALFCAALPTSLSQASRSAGLPSSTAGARDAFEAFWPGGVGPPSPSGVLLPSWSCCHLSEDLASWRTECSRPGRPLHSSWHRLQTGCACCNATDDLAGDQLGCTCRGSNITAVPQIGIIAQLPTAVSLM